MGSVTLYDAPVSKRRGWPVGGGQEQTIVALRTIPYVKELTYCIEDLCLEAMTLTGNNLIAVRTQKQLKALHSQNRKLNLSAIDCLTKLDSPQFVDASGTNLDDSSFDVIAALPSMREIDVSNTEVDRATIRRTEEDDPDLVVHNRECINHCET